MSSKITYLIPFEGRTDKSDPDDTLKAYDHLINSTPGNFIITMLAEPFLWADFSGWSKKIIEEIEKKQHTVYFFINSSFNYDHLDADLRSKIFLIDFYISDAVFRYYYDKSVTSSNSWNSASTKGLLLSGKPDYYNRYQTVIHLDQVDRLKDFVYSFNGNTVSDLRDIKLFYPNNNDIIEKIKKLTNSLDIEYKDQHYSGYPFDINLYKNTVLSLIPEGVLDYHNDNLASMEELIKLEYYYSETDNPFITEKTYRAILNHHPFIILGLTNTLTYLESIGFKTFREYLKYPDYNEMKSLRDRIYYGVENSIHFLDTYAKNRDKINQDIIHNFNNLIKVAHQQWNSVPLIRNDNNLLFEIHVNCSFDLLSDNLKKISINTSIQL